MLAEALPVVGAAAADYARPPQRGDGLMAVFAVFDGASAVQNRSISPADIERLERLEEATDAVLLQLAKLEAVDVLADEALLHDLAERVQQLLDELPGRRQE